MFKPQTKKYFDDLQLEVKKAYDIAGEAKAKGLDPVDEVEIPLAISMAEKVVGLISTVYPQMKGSGIAKRITELENEFGKMDPTVVFKIGEEVAKQKFCEFSSLIEAIDAGVRVGFAYITLAVVSSPIEGYTGIRTRKTKDGKDYIEASFSGPIRSAGTTASCIVLMLIDYLRELFGFAKYDPTEEEIKRVWTELEFFHDRITNLQYMPTEQEALFIARNMPIQVAGEASERLEVPNYKNLERVDTNFLRSGFCLIMAEGLAQKAAKGFRLLGVAKKNGIESTGFDWIEKYVEMHEASSTGKKTEVDDRPTYIRDLVAGRPVFGHPSRSGAFRFRYGRGRNSGFSAVSFHPATMAITDDFIAVGTQLKIEKPTKGCVASVCDTIDGPIVKLFNGSVKKLKDMEEARRLYKDTEEIIYSGDILFPFSDLANRNAQMVKPGYVEEWWKLELEEKDKDFSEGVNEFEVSLEEAMEISKKHEISLHPEFIYYWKEISNDEFFALVEWLSKAVVREGKIVFPFGKSEQDKYEKAKRALELLGIEHDVTIENVVLNKKLSKVFFVNLGLYLGCLEKEEFFLKDVVGVEKFKKISKENVLEILNEVSEFEIRDKSGDFIGTRMGRPEKAKLRKLTGSPNVLFPVGNEGGRLRSVQTACEVGKVRGQFPFLICESCKKETIYPTCEKCGGKTRKKYYFFKSKESSFEKVKEDEEKPGVPYKYTELDINYYLEDARARLGLQRSEMPLLIKSVRGMSSDDKSLENLAKGILRAKYNLQVNKDGTIRFDCTELPLSHFKPKEIGASVGRLRELGYEKDYLGKELVSDEQILELMPHDILLPCCPDSSEEKADDVFFRVGNFIDEELEKFYGLKPFYNFKSKEDLIGTLGVCMAPHNCAGVVARIIGFSKVQGLMASSYMHAAIRRDCDGDEAAVMLLGDVLINFSRKFLPGHRGGTQDAPLVLNSKIDAGEVDDQILDFEAVPEGHYPLDLYRKAEQRVHSSQVEVEIIKKILKKEGDPFLDLGFTHDTDNFNEGVLCSNYKILETMQDKVDHQMALVEKLRAADTSDTARLIIDRHFIRDMRGNLRKFSMQGFRCVNCNESYRRPPLDGKCHKCSKGKIIFTIHEGGIKKYLQPAMDLINKYHLSNYMRQHVELTKRFIDSIFGRELEQQNNLEEWFG